MVLTFEPSGKIILNMPPFLRFVIMRFLAIPVTLLIVTMTLFAFVLLTPPEVRARCTTPTGFRHT